MREENSGLEGHRFTSYNDLPDLRKIQTGHAFKGVRFGQVGTVYRCFGRQAASSSNVRRIPEPGAHICLRICLIPLVNPLCCCVVVTLLSARVTVRFFHCYASNVPVSVSCRAFARARRIARSPF
jgi:hypothetical protein